MATFSESALVKKLADLNPSQQSIQTLSLWLIHHRKHYAAIVKVWYKELVKGGSDNVTENITQFSKTLWNLKFQNTKLPLFIELNLVDLSEE